MSRGLIFSCLDTTEKGKEERRNDERVETFLLISFGKEAFSEYSTQVHTNPKVGLVPPWSTVHYMQCHEYSTQVHKNLEVGLVLP